MSERAEIQAARKRRKMEGKDWEPHLDERTKKVYYYNSITHECTWVKPEILVLREAVKISRQKRFADHCDSTKLQSVDSFDTH